MSRPPQWVSRCPRCRASTELNDGVRGCEDCAADGVAMPLVPERVDEVPVSPPPSAVAGVGPMWRWSELLPPVGVPVSLGEGGAPLVEVDLDVSGRVLLKDERANPTGSFKDRLASAAVSRARHVGAETVATASSGNAGIAVAAYAAAAGLGSILFAAEPGLPSPTAEAVAALGTRIVTTATYPDRWAAVRTGVERLGWSPITNYLMPPVSSHPIGVHAYRTIAYEIAESLGWAVPDWVVVPVSRGDGLFGIWAGFAEMAELGWTGGVPRMLAVERYPSLTDALARGLEQPVAMEVETVRAASIGDPQATAMAANALRTSGGHAVACDDDEIARGWSRLASRGVLLEFSSAAVVPGVEALQRGGMLDESATVVLLATAGPYAQPTLPAPSDAIALADPTDVDALRTAGSPI
jgi:threonine synthase